MSVPPARAFRATARVLDDLDLHTVCSEARCPNKGECFAAGTATFLILGDRCTRDCRFCSVRHGAPDGEPDADEPRRVAAAAARLELRHVVVTSVTRDDLADGGAARFAAVIGEVRAALPDATIEVLTPDFGGDEAALRAVLAAAPDVFNHNLETVPRLYARVRPAADYGRSLEVLRRAARSWRGAAPGGACRPVVKTGLMLGLGETRAEVEAVLRDAHAAGVGVITVGQYLRPAPGCLPVARYVTPGELAEWTLFGESIGLVVVAGPFVRSSYRAGEALARVAGSQARGCGS
ncbi:MAG: lipoyl synthase [Actinobacteria bacterium]|nr:lipoyl synthase [Actinomycetota bacterium]